MKADKTKYHWEELSYNAIVHLQKGTDKQKREAKQFLMNMAKKMEGIDKCQQLIVAEEIRNFYKWLNVPTLIGKEEVEEYISIAQELRKR